MKNSQTPVSDRLGAIGEGLFVGVQGLLPQHALSRIIYALTRLRAGPMTTFAIRAFAKVFDVDLSSATQTDAGRYASFNAFFTRALRPGARPLDSDPSTVLSPVDGAVSQLGRITAGRMIQAKGQLFDVEALLGGAEHAAAFADGAFATLYLSPRDYHRVHMPLAGRLTHCAHIPGRLFSVNAVTAARVPCLYARNERVVCIFQTSLGPMAMVLVGAIFVGGIELAWQGEVTPPRARSLQILPVPEPAPTLDRGDEMGRFNMGSTVVLLLPKDAVEWLGEIEPGTSVRFGQAIAKTRR